MQSVEIYTDGACRGNPGPGGWGALLRFPDFTQELSGAVELTTNNRMELQAPISALQSLSTPHQVKLVTDSEYVLKGMTIWLKAWQARAWRTAGNKPVKNQDLWEALSAAALPHQIEWHWVKGHSGHADNERVDQLAGRAIDLLLQGVSHATNHTGY